MKKNIKDRLDKICKKYMKDYLAGNYNEAYNGVFKAHKLMPKNIGFLNDMATFLILMNNWQKGIEVSKKVLKLNPNYINALDAASHGSFALKNFDDVKKYGSKALILKDKKIEKIPFLGKNYNEKGKNLISFCLFGSLAKYCETAVINAQIYKEIYPSWSCRFYVDETVPKGVISRLEECGCEIVFPTEKMKKMPKTMWRFLPLNDKDVNYIIFRDCDSIISRKEARCVNEWLNSNKDFHIIRDSGSHTELILAGTWGARTGVVENLDLLIEDFLKKPINSQKFADQEFLREYIWAYARQSLLSHDNLFDFNSTKFELTQFEKENGVTIGQNEATLMFHVKSNLPDGSKVRWELYSKIAPLINEDFSEKVVENRLICKYISEVKNSQISAEIPNIYAKGFSTQNSSLKVFNLD